MDFAIQVLLICVSIAPGLSQISSSGDMPVDMNYIDSASVTLFSSSIYPMCIDKTQSQGQLNYPSGLSMENLISLIERFEIKMVNDTNPNIKMHVGADNLAKVFLRRFRFDFYDPENKDADRGRRADLSPQINTAFLRSTAQNIDPNSYTFPDRYYTTAELCSLFYMLSHTVYDVEEATHQYSAPFKGYNRGKRQAYNNRQNQQNQRQSGAQNSWNSPAVQSPFLPRPFGNNGSFNGQPGYPIRELGVVSFRSSGTEAIAPGRVLLGVIAGYTTDAKTTFNQVYNAMTQQTNPDLDKPADAVAAVTLSDLWAYGKEDNDRTYAFGQEGVWNYTSCTTHYGLKNIPKADFDQKMKPIVATKAEIRGGVDGYMLGRKLRALGAPDRQKLKLSTILRSFYSKQRTSTSMESYCQRNAFNDAQLSPTADGFNILLTKLNFKKQQGLLNEFTGALDAAKAIDTTVSNDYCNAGSSTDKNAPCETPSDVIYVIDATNVDKLRQSAGIVARINGNLHNMRPYGGAVTIFVNSDGKSPNQADLHMPAGQWNFGAVTYNNSNTGCAQCRIDDLITSPNQVATTAPVANMGKYFKYLNQSLTGYKYWSPTLNMTAVPGKTAVLIDLGTVPKAPDSGEDSNDYNYYKGQLRYKNRDVRFLSIAQNADLFKDLLRNEKNELDDTSGASHVAPTGQVELLARKICDNPATFQWMPCDDRRSNDATYTGYITPGYKQNWAMYPEFFHRSFDITFTFKAEDGGIRVCYDRYFPPERTDAWYCRDVAMGAEESWGISNPCKDESVSSCRPFYFTVWGTSRASGYCQEDGCMSLDQIKFTVKHSGVQCSSSHHLLPSMTFQFISITIFIILYQFLNK